ncbi:Methyl-accepting chemotaxis protein [Marinobacterium lacunae]|uniref:Methyl-accepting chemotaxis protein n=1 Tax=Marinobacterium lacunae TaxID=1232683 RepID=A0A081FUT8_9GAMM|nr:Methyl-accepting chemotaxis protein [Marinobacterium lacunae]
MRLLLHQLGLHGLIGLVALLPLASFALYMTTSYSLLPSLLIIAYLSMSGLWITLFELSLLQHDCEAQAEGQGIPGATEYLILKPLSRAFYASVTRERRIQQRLQQKLDEISHASHELETSAEQVTHSAEYQRDAASTASAAVEELNVSILEVTELANNSRQSSIAATEQLQQSCKELLQLIDAISAMAQQALSTNELMRQLSHNSQTINEMSCVIQGIADQTNLLSLNAAIEAARAGESGRGFSVVADEVRRLAKSSQQSAAEISRNIDDIQTHIQEAGAQMSSLSTKAEQSVQVSEAVRTLLEGVRSLTDRLTEEVVQVAVSTEQQSQAVAEIANLADQVSQGNAENLRSADQARTIAHHLAHLTEPQQ